MAARPITKHWQSQEKKKKKRTHDAPFAAELPGFVTIYETKRSKRSKRSQFQDKWYLLPSKNI
jgi:hypothetical protein